jgi:hypothetical protein
MSDTINRKSLEDFFNGMSVRSPIMLFFMMLFSTGSYLVLWVYKLNKRFEDFDSDNSPNSARGIVILFLMPVLWIILMFVLKVLIFNGEVKLWFYVDVIGWSFIVFLALQYLYDFCICFGKFTFTNGFVWYMFLWIGFFPLVLLPFGSFYFLPILFFPIIVIPVMQYRLNYEIERFERGVSGSKFYVKSINN